MDHKSKCSFLLAMRERQRKLIFKKNRVQNASASFLKITSMIPYAKDSAIFLPILMD